MTQEDNKIQTYKHLAEAEDKFEKAFKRDDREEERFWWEVTQLIREQIRVNGWEQ